MQNLQDGNYLSYPFSDIVKWEILEKKLKKLSEFDEKKINNEDRLDIFLSIINQDKEEIIEKLSEDTRNLFFQNQKLHSFLAKICLESPKYLKNFKIPIFYKQIPKEFSFTKRQVAIIIALMYFGLYLNNDKKNFPSTQNFNYILYSESLEFLKCLYNYFYQIEKYYDYFDLDKIQLTYIRNSLKNPINILKDNFDKKLTIPKLSQSFIEEMHGAIQIDFANKFISGGALCGGNVQEEIRFFISPELLPSILLFEKMDENEAIIFIGAEQFSTYTGYGYSFEFTGTFNDENKIDKFGRKDIVLSAIDAINFKKLNESQFGKNMIQREITKALAGFLIYEKQNLEELKRHNNKPIATGNWGCGVFGGNKDLKFLIQWLAASCCERDMYYSCFNDHHYFSYLEKYIGEIQQINPTIAKFYDSLIKISERYDKKSSNNNIFFIEKFIEILNNKPNL